MEQKGYMNVKKKEKKTDEKDGLTHTHTHTLNTYTHKGTFKGLFVVVHSKKKEREETCEDKESTLSSNPTFSAPGPSQRRELY